MYTSTRVQLAPDTPWAGARPGDTLAVAGELGCSAAGYRLWHNSIDGFDELRQAISGALVGEERLRDTATISNTRHITLLEQCRVSLVAGRDAAEAANVPEEFVLTDLQAARARLDEIVGRRTSEDVLRHIFERFCIGK